MAVMSVRSIFISMLIERRVGLVFRIYIKNHLFTRFLSSSLQPPSVHKVLLLACSSVYCLLHSIYLILFFSSSLIALCVCVGQICLLSLHLSPSFSLAFIRVFSPLFLPLSNKSIAKEYLYTL